MPWFRRSRAAPPATSTSPPRDGEAVLVPSDLAAALTADGETLQDAVEAALRAHLGGTGDPRSAAFHAGVDTGAPVWLDRGGAAEDAMTARLRDRLERRRAGDDQRGD